MDTAEFISKAFIEANAQREQARAKLFEAVEKTINASLILENKKNSLINAGALTATNEPGRKAQLAELTVHSTCDLLEAEQSERRARFNFDFAQAEYDLCRYRLRIAELASHQ